MVGNGLLGTRLVLLGAAVALGSTACSNSVPQEEPALVAASGIGAPVEATAQIGGVPGGSFLRDGSSAQLVAALANAGILDFTTDTSHAPWWRVTFSQGRMQPGNFLIYPLGHRNITGRSDQRWWSEGPNSYFAETITYNVALDDRYHVSQHEYGPFTVRLVLVNDPAAGGWRLDQRSDLTAIAGDNAQGVALIQSTGDPASLTTRLAQLASQSDALIASQVIAQTGLRPAGDDGVVRREAAHLAFFVPGADLADRASDGNARSTCAAQHVGSLSWHLASKAEADTATFNQNNHLAIDTPSSALWHGRLQGVFVLILDGWVGPPVPLTSTVGLRQDWYLGLQGNGEARFDTQFPNNYGLAVQDVMVAWNVNDGRTHRRPLCAARLA